MNPQTRMCIKCVRFLPVCGKSWFQKKKFTSTTQYERLPKCQKSQPKPRLKRPSIKDVRTKLRKIDPCWPQNVHTSSTPLSVQIHHKFRKIWSFLYKKVRTSASEGPSYLLVRRTGNPPSSPPPWVRTSFMGNFKGWKLDTASLQKNS